MRRKNSDIIDQVAETGLDISGHIYEVPAAVFSEGLSTALELKDAVKHQVGLNPCKQNGERALLYRTLSNGTWAYNRTLNPRKEGEWSRFVRLANQQPNRYRLVRPKFKARRNSAEAAEDFYETFHGEPSQETVVVEKTFHEHSHTGGIGPLVECWIETPTGLLVCLEFPRNDMPMLSANEEKIVLDDGTVIRPGSQLYIDGGNQHVDLGKLEFTGSWVKERMNLGTFAQPSEDLEELQRSYVEKGQKYSPWNITYQTRKSFDGFELTDYQHWLGEPDEGKTQWRQPPDFHYDPVNEQLYVVGGEYQIKLPLVGVSAGIEN